MSFQRGDHGPEVKALQEQLLVLGYPLPRFGDDGWFGEETEAALERCLLDHHERGGDPSGEHAGDTGYALDSEIAFVAALYHSLPANDWPEGLVDCTAKHDGKNRIRTRGWPEITGITLHQTACDLGEHPERWYNIPVQMGVTRQGKILLLNPIESLTWHGHGLNGADVGIECDGRYEGVEGDLSTYWKTPGHPELWTPERPTQELLEAARQTVKWIVAEVSRHGGRVRYIHAHRQASDQRRPDPGSRIWQDVGLWAQRELGLSDGGDAFHLGSGYRIPEAWDPSRKGVPY